MRDVVGALHDNNSDVGKLIKQMISAVNRMNYLICAATVAVLMLGVQLFLGLTSREMIVEANKQRAVERIARRQLVQELHEANVATAEIQKRMIEIERHVQDIPHAQSDKPGGVVLSVPMEENVGESVDTPPRQRRVK
jgi:hypothetical protein